MIIWDTLADNEAILPHLTYRKAGSRRRVFLNDATVTFSLYTTVGALVSGFNALPCEYIEDSDGTYIVDAPSSVIPAVGSYVGKFTAVKDSFNRTFQTAVQVVTGLEE